MMRRLMLLLALFVLPSLASAAPLSRSAAGMVRVVLTTSAGPITLDLDAKHAPITTANFLRYVDQKLFDGTAFYRAAKSAPGFGFVQGGVRNSPRRVLAPIAHEPTTKTGLHHVAGTISMARTTPGSAEGDFFICTGRMPDMDAHPGRRGDNQGFAAFGHVVSGMAVVRKILAMPTFKTGAGAMKGQILTHPVTIISARRAG